MDTLLTEYGLVKTDPVQYGKVEREYILKIRREAYGYDCLTGQKQFFRENYPELVVEDINLEEVVAMSDRRGMTMRGLLGERFLYFKKSDKVDWRRRFALLLLSNCFQRELQ